MLTCCKKSYETNKMGCRARLPYLCSLCSLETVRSRITRCRWVGARVRKRPENSGAFVCVSECTMRYHSPMALSTASVRTVSELRLSILFACCFHRLPVCAFLFWHTIYLVIYTNIKMTLYFDAEGLCDNRDVFEEIRTHASCISFVQHKLCKQINFLRMRISFLFLLNYYLVLEMVWNKFAKRPHKLPVISVKMKRRCNKLGLLI